MKSDMKLVGQKKAVCINRADWDVFIAFVNLVFTLSHCGLIFFFTPVFLSLDAFLFVQTTLF